MLSLLRCLAGAFYIMILSAVVGLASNALRPDGLPLIRKHLRETRPIISKAQLLHDIPASSESGGAIEAAKSMPTSETSSGKASAPLGKESEGTIRSAPSKHIVLRTGKPQSSIIGHPGPARSKTERRTEMHVQALFTTLEDAKACFDKAGALFVDARPIEDYESEHIAGAVWLYYDKLDQLYDRVLGSLPKDRLIITYCSDSECEAAVKLADALVARGHKRVMILLEGLPGWNDAGYPTASGKEPC